MSERRTQTLNEAIDIMARLRGPGGCAWDRAQTFDTIKRHTLEETYEVFDAIERRAWPDLQEELGDLLLQVLFYAQMAEDAGYFAIEDVAAGLAAKLVRRHPHVFGDAVATTPEAVNATWEAVKRSEKKMVVGAFLDAVPRHVPAMLEAEKLGAKAAKVGFDWPDARGLLAKVAEECAEIEAELEGREQARLTDEVGDLLFTVVNLARHLRVEPEFALRAANAKFRSRFGAMENLAGVEERSAEEWERLWSLAKRAIG